MGQVLGLDGPVLEIWFCHSLIEQPKIQLTSQNLIFTSVSTHTLLQINYFKNEK